MNEYNSDNRNYNNSNNKFNQPTVTPSYLRPRENNPKITSPDPSSLKPNTDIDKELQALIDSQKTRIKVMVGEETTPSTELTK